jgi:hypothetical protein
VKAWFEVRDARSTTWAADMHETGGIIELGFFQGTTIYLETLAQPACDPQRIVMPKRAEWSGSRLIFQFEALANGTMLRFRHADWRSEADHFVSGATTWGELMLRLKSAAQGKPRDPWFLADSLSP